ncbi:MAG: hypothetical protein DMG38_01060 [Acidobacteria bacterium]|nr:MAG: hypothetical protein DMG38_01060 [Acidobacteriota bacterium]
MGHTFLKDSAGKSPSVTEYGAFCALGNEGLELGFPHGMPPTNAEQINEDLLAFLKGAGTAAAS